MPICQYCGNKFKYRFRSSEKFCSKNCCNLYHQNKNRKHRICVVCGNELTGHQRSYCSDKCRTSAKVARQMELNSVEYKKPKAEVKEEPKKRGRPKKKLSLVEICKLAREEGLNYGQYVAKYGL